MLHFAQRVSEKNTALTGTGAGMFAQSAGFVPSNVLQMARKKSLLLRPPSYGLPFKYIVGEPVAPRLLDSSNDAASSALPLLSMHALTAPVSMPTCWPQLSQFVSIFCGSLSWHAIILTYLSGATSRAQSCAMSP